MAGVSLDVVFFQSRAWARTVQFLVKFVQQKGVFAMSDVRIERIDDFRVRIPKEGKMRTEGVVYADERMMRDIRNDQSLNQVANVAWLPGIVGPSMAMPDIHWGYGFPIGGVAAFDTRTGVVSPGGVGYDIN
jgi:tRNA-splicing ligase RtcB